MHVCCACDVLPVGMSSFFAKEHFLVIFRSWVVVDTSPDFLCDWFVSYKSFCFMVSSCVRWKRVCFSGCTFFEGLDLALWVSLSIAPFMPLSAATVPTATKSTVCVHVNMS